MMHRLCPKFQGLSRASFDVFWLHLTSFDVFWRLLTSFDVSIWRSTSIDVSRTSSIDGNRRMTSFDFKRRHFHTTFPSRLIINIQNLVNNYHWIIIIIMSDVPAIKIKTFPGPSIFFSWINSLFFFFYYFLYKDTFP